MPQVIHLQTHRPLIVECDKKECHCMTGETQGRSCSLPAGPGEKHAAWVILGFTLGILFIVGAASWIASTQN